MTIFLIVLLTALVFEYINGFHDAANAIATVVSTKVLTPRQAIALAAVFNLIGALMGTAVASTIGKGLVDTNVVTMATIFSGLMGAIIWNLITWWFGLPSSSSHALIGGLCGAALASAGDNWNVLHWATTDAKGAAAGLWPKVVLPMITSPLVGFFGGAFLMFLLTLMIHRLRPRLVNNVFGKLQLVSAGLMAHSHGSNDAQKTMGIIALALFTGTSSGAFDDLPAWASFLRTPEFVVDQWVVVTCAHRHGRRHRGRRLAHHPHDGPQDGQASAGARLRRRDDRRPHHPLRLGARHSPVHHPRHLHLHHGRRRGQAPRRREMDRRRAHPLGLGFHPARLRPDRLSHRAALRRPRLQVRHLRPPVA
jgi:PiT family inorganic phosphate transporter